MSISNSVYAALWSGLIYWVVQKATEHPDSSYTLIAIFMSLMAIQAVTRPEKIDGNPHSLKDSIRESWKKAKDRSDQKTTIEVEQ